MAEKGVHPKHRLTRYDLFFLKHIQPSDRILDLGCGNGSLAAALGRKARFVLALDNNPRQIAAAREKHAAPNVEYRIADITIALPRKNFDAIILSNVLEHIDDRVSFLKKISERALKILIRVPLLDRGWLALYKKELRLPWRLDPTHYTEYTLNTLKKELSKAGLILKKYSIQYGELWGVITKT